METMHSPSMITNKYEDQCGCRTSCSYPNNVWAILPAQIAVLCAFLSTGNTVVNCRLVQVLNTPEAGIDQFTIDDIFHGFIPTDFTNSTTRSLGIFTWESVNGDCFFGQSPKGLHDEQKENYESDDALEKYWNFLGDDWHLPKVMAILAIVISFIVLFWTIGLFSCVANTRRYRISLVILLTVFMPLFQASMLLVLRTDFCKTNNCTLDDSGECCIVATILYFIAGIILHFGTTNYPGNPYKKRKPRQYFLGLRGGTNNENVDTIPNNDSPTASDIVNHNNGFADAIEIPVESNFIDRTLFDADAISPSPDPIATETTATTTMEPTIETSDTLFPDFSKIDTTVDTTVDTNNDVIPNV
jgi:hypothetical protein